MKDNDFFQQYKDRLKHEKKIVLLWQIIIFISTFSLWEYASRMHWIDPLIFSSPSRVVSLLWEKFADGSMFLHLQVTLFETVLGFIIGTVSGIIIATVLWSSKRLEIGRASCRERVKNWERDSRLRSTIS